MIDRILHWLGERLGRKMIAAFIVVIVVVLAIFTVFSAVREGGRVKADLREQGEMLVKLLSHSVVLGVFSENEAMLRDAAEGILRLKNVVAVAIYNTDAKLLYFKAASRTSGHIEATSAGADGGPSGGRSVIFTETRDSFTISVPVAMQVPAYVGESLYFGDAGPAGDGRVIGRVGIVLSKDTYYRKIASVVTQHAAIMLIFILSSGIIAHFAVKKVTLPLEKLTESVKALEQGASVEPVTIETNDEIGNLATAFNAMMAARSRAEEALRKSEYRFRLIAETISEVFWLADADMNKMLYVSPEYERAWGRSLESLYSAPESFPTAFYPDDREGARVAIERAGPGQPFEREYRIVRPDGSVRRIWERGYPVRDETGVLTCYVGVAQDVTERKGMEEQIKSYRTELRTAALELSSIESRVEERERHLIATDLHDFVGQNLIVLNFKLGALAKGLTNQADIGRLEEVRELIGQTIQYTRSLTVELSPRILVELGLAAAIQALAEGYRTTYGIDVIVEDDGLRKEADEDTRYMLFRSVRELLMNAVKHSKAVKIVVSLTKQDDTFVIIVRDDGVGFDPGRPTGKQDGFGLHSIFERLKRLGGSCVIDSGPGRGATIVLTAPLKQ